MMAVVFTVDAEAAMGHKRISNDEILDDRERELRRADPVRQHRPAQG